MSDDDFDSPAEHNRASMSAARAKWMDEQGITGKNRRIVLNSIALSGDRGECEREGERATGMTHQSYSGARSWLHRHGHVHRLRDERREHGSVYVTRLYVNDRPTEPFKPNRGEAQEDNDAPVPADVTAAVTRLRVTIAKERALSIFVMLEGDSVTDLLAVLDYIEPEGSHG